MKYYVQFVERASSGGKYTEFYTTEEERFLAVQDAKSEGYIPVRSWEEKEEGDIV